MSVAEWFLELETKLDEAQKIDDMQAKSQGRATRAQMKAAVERLKAKQAARNDGTQRP